MLNLKQEWIDQLKGNQVETNALEVFWHLFPDLTFETALGGVLKILQGGGQKRTEGFGPPGESSEDYLFATSGEEPKA